MALLGPLVSFVATPSLLRAIIEILNFYCYITNLTKAAGLTITVTVVYVTVGWLRVIGLEWVTHGLGETQRVGSSLDLTGPSSSQNVQGLSRRRLRTDSQLIYIISIPDNMYN